MLTDDVENTDGINQGGDLRFAKKPRVVSRGTERVPLGNHRNKRTTIYRPTHLPRE